MKVAASASGDSGISSEDGPNGINRRITVHQIESMNKARARSEYVARRILGSGVKSSHR
jgi:hypothetical protein